MGAFEFRRAKSADYPAILRLQSEYYIGNLSEEEQTQGFLSAEFSREQIAVMAEDLGIMVAADAGLIAGYLCAFRNQFEHGSPVLAKMFESYEHVKFEGKTLSSYRSYAYGPVCIGREYRQRGLLRGLYQAQRKDLAGQFDIGVAFVSRSNSHSLQAHVAGLGMAEVGDFEVKGNVYVILAFPLPVK
jgi:predicted GNAT superfamily acetyltransferase